jgi:hypothetical protein
LRARTQDEIEYYVRPYSLQFFSYCLQLIRVANDLLNTGPKCVRTLVAVEYEDAMSGERKLVDNVLADEAVSTNGNNCYLTSHSMHRWVNGSIAGSEKR